MTTRETQYPQIRGTARMASAPVRAARIGIVAFGLGLPPMAPALADWDRHFTQHPSTGGGSIYLYAEGKPHGSASSPGTSQIVANCDNLTGTGLHVFRIDNSFGLRYSARDRNEHWDRQVSEGQTTWLRYTLDVTVDGRPQKTTFTTTLNSIHPVAAPENPEAIGHDFARLEVRRPSEVSIVYPTLAGDIEFTYDVSGFSPDLCG